MRIVVFRPVRLRVKSRARTLERISLDVWWRIFGVTMMVEPRPFEKGDRENAKTSLIPHNAEMPFRTVQRQNRGNMPGDIGTRSNEVGAKNRLLLAARLLPE